MKRCEQIFLKAYYSTENCDSTIIDHRIIALRNIQSESVAVIDGETKQPLMYIYFKPNGNHEITIADPWVEEDVEYVNYKILG